MKIIRRSSNTHTHTYTQEMLASVEMRVFLREVDGTGTGNAKR